MQNFLGSVPNQSAYCSSLFLLGCTALLQLSLDTFSSVWADQVWLAPQRPTKADSTWYPRPVRVIEGEIQDFDARQFQILVRGDTKPSRFAAHRVAWVEVSERSDLESKAISLFSNGKYNESLRPFISAIEKRPPVWRQQWLSMMAAQAAWRGGKGEISLELVSQLDGRPLPTLVQSWLPIDWDGKVRDARGQAIVDEDAALSRIDDDSAAVRLVAASWLLSTSDSRKRAITALNGLQVEDKRPIIARLAEAVLWRAAPPPEVLTSSNTWQQRINQFPMVLQTGPTKTLAVVCERAGLKEEATKLKLSLELMPMTPKLP